MCLKDEWEEIKAARGNKKTGAKQSEKTEETPTNGKRKCVNVQIL